MLERKMLNLKFFLMLTLICGSLYAASAQGKPQKVLRHVVAFQFKPEVTLKQQAQAIQIFRDLTAEIPEIKKFEGGADISTGGLNKGFSHCFVLTFESEAARDIYLPHPAHVKVVEQNKPLFSNLMVLDFWGEE